MYCVIASEKNWRAPPYPWPVSNECLLDTAGIQSFEVAVVTIWHRPGFAISNQNISSRIFQNPGQTQGSLLSARRVMRFICIAFTRSPKMEAKETETRKIIKNRRPFTGRLTLALSFRLTSILPVGFYQRRKVDLQSQFSEKNNLLSLLLFLWRFEVLSLFC